MGMEGFLTSREIGERLGISKSTAVRMGRAGRFGPPVCELSRTWRWRDDFALAGMLSVCWQGEKRNPTRQAVVHTNFHLKRVIDFAKGARDDCDDEDLQMASELLSIAARCHERRAAGLRSTATLSARFAVMNLLSKARAGDPTIPQRLRGTAARLSDRACSADA